MRSTTAFLALASIALLPFATPLESRAQTCNGYAEYCDRIYSNVSWIGTHDSAFVGSTIDPRVNQEESVSAQLDAGIRFLQAQTHKNSSGTGLEMCHTSCIELDAGSLVSYLTTIATWLEANVDEVLTLLLVNGDDVNVTEFDAAFQAAGLKQYAFTPSTSPNELAIGDWPTYGEMISNGTRIVVFMDYEADESVVPYILDEVST
jgi:hypothetical protein